MELTLIYGPMFSGKSKKLIDFYNEISSKYGEKSILAVKPNIDTRTQNFLFSRDYDTKIFAHNIENSNGLYEKMHNQIEFIFIDEAHFFDVSFVGALKKLNKKTYVSCLDKTYQAEKWKIFPKLLGVATNKIKLTAQCYYKNCQNPATLSIKRNGGNNVVEVDDIENSIYCASCKKHYFEIVRVK